MRLPDVPASVDVRAHSDTGVISSTSESPPAGLCPVSHPVINPHAPDCLSSQESVRQEQINALQMRV